MMTMMFYVNKSFKSATNQQQALKAIDSINSQCYSNNGAHQQHYHHHHHHCGQQLHSSGDSCNITPATPPILDIEEEETDKQLVDINNKANIQLEKAATYRFQGNTDGDQHLACKNVGENRNYFGLSHSCHCCRQQPQYPAKTTDIGNIRTYYANGGEYLVNSGKSSNIVKQQEQQQQQQQIHGDTEMQPAAVRQQQQQRIYSQHNNSTWYCSNINSNTSCWCCTNNITISNCNLNTSTTSMLQCCYESVNANSINLATSTTTLSPLQKQLQKHKQPVTPIATTPPATPLNATAAAVAETSSQLNQQHQHQQQHQHRHRHLRHQFNAATSATSPPSHPHRLNSTKSLTTTTTTATTSSTLASSSSIYYFGYNIIRHFGLQLCCLLLLRLTMAATGLAVGADTANANLTDLGSPGMYKEKPNIITY